MHVRFFLMAILASKWPLFLAASVNQASIDKWFRDTRLSKQHQRSRDEVWPQPATRYDDRGLTVFKIEYCGQAATSIAILQQVTLDANRVLRLDIDPRQDV